MKIKEGFVMREVAGQTMVIATGKASENFSGMIRLNGTAKEIWLLVEQGYSMDDIVKSINEKYVGNSGKVRSDVERIILTMTEYGFIEV